jgi:hypothetical protein
MTAALAHRRNERFESSPPESRTCRSPQNAIENRSTTHELGYKKKQPPQQWRFSLLIDSLLIRTNPTTAQMIKTEI